jgi:hypothetical protein
MPSASQSLVQAQIQLLIRPTARRSPKLPVRWNRKSPPSDPNWERSVSHRGKAHGRDRRAGNTYRIVTSPLERQHEGRKMSSPVHTALEMTCSRWIRHAKAGTTCRHCGQPLANWYGEELVHRLLYSHLTAVVDLTMGASQG